MGSSEQDARILVNELLKTANWDITDKFQVKTEVPVVYSDFVKETQKNTYLKENYEISKSGFADYVLYDQTGRPLAVVEAKKEAFDPYRAKQQVLPYAKSINAPFIFLSNGDLIYFWDYHNDDARVVNSFFSRKDLEKQVYMREEKKPLATIEIPDYYLRQGETRELRSYQKDAMKALDHALELGKRRFLIELPTGTGKTDLIALYVKRLFQAGRAQKVLFLVDREQLAKQALEAFQDLLPEYGSYWMKSSIERQEKQITVSLLQTMISRFEDFTSGYFDVVIMDESHRSIYGAWQTALTHFDAIQIGLTATPSDFIEKNTFDFYQCEDGKPDFSYKIQDALKNNFLVPYKFAERITKILTEGADKEEMHYDPAEFEKKFTNEDTNMKMMKEFDTLALENYTELADNQKYAPGKSIVFAITKNHATRLAKYLNDLHPEHKGKYAEIITSDVANPDEQIRKFKYDTYPMVAVSVGMLDTGFDCREVLHIVLCRRIRSPILYQQIRGRGTRTCPKIGKRKFMIYDFFENHKYFNDSESEIFTGTGGFSTGEGKPRPPTPREIIELGLEDEWMYGVNYVEVGFEGERIDKKEYISNWEDAIKSSAEGDQIIQKIINHEKATGKEEKLKYTLTQEEEDQLSEKLNQPEMYFNEDNLRKAYRNPAGTFLDFIKKALGLIKTKSKEEEISETFNAWLISRSFTPEQSQYLSILKNRGMARGKVELEDLFKPPLSILNIANTGINLFGEEKLKEVINELNEEILNFKKAV